MANVLVYYPFAKSPWFGKSVEFTLNSQKHNIEYLTESPGRSLGEKFEAFAKIAFDPQNRLYIVGHCGAGENDLYSEPSISGDEDSIDYTDLARKIVTYTGGSPVLATIKVLACESGAATFGAAPVKAIYDFFGKPVPKEFLSFAQKLWDELYYEYGFRGTCHAYTRSVYWEIYTERTGDTIRAVRPPEERKAGDPPSSGHRWFIDDDDFKRAKECRVNVVATPKK